MKYANAPKNGSTATQPNTISPRYQLWAYTGCCRITGVVGRIPKTGRRNEQVCNKWQGISMLPNIHSVLHIFYFYSPSLISNWIEKQSGDENERWRMSFFEIEEWNFRFNMFLVYVIPNRTLMKEKKTMYKTKKNFMMDKVQICKPINQSINRSINQSNNQIPSNQFKKSICASIGITPAIGWLFDCIGD